MYFSLHTQLRSLPPRDFLFIEIHFIESETCFVPILKVSFGRSTNERDDFLSINTFQLCVCWGGGGGEEGEGNGAGRGMTTFFIPESFSFVSCRF